MEDAKHELEVAQRDGQFERASQLRFQTIPELEGQLPHHDSDSYGNSLMAGEDITASLMLNERVTSNDIARVVAKATGVSLAPHTFAAGFTMHH